MLVNQGITLTACWIIQLSEWYLAFIWYLLLHWAAVGL